VPLDPEDWTQSENDAAAGFLVDGDDAAARGLYGAARDSWSKGAALGDDELGAPLAARLRTLRGDRVFWAVGVVVIALDVFLMLAFVGAQ
jgi:hypothetical protein